MRGRGDGSREGAPGAPPSPQPSPRLRVELESRKVSPRDCGLPFLPSAPEEATMQGSSAGTPWSPGGWGRE